MKLIKILFQSYMRERELYESPAELYENNVPSMFLEV